MWLGDIIIQKHSYTIFLWFPYGLCTYPISTHLYIMCVYLLVTLITKCCKLCVRQVWQVMRIINYTVYKHSGEPIICHQILYAHTNKPCTIHILRRLTAVGTQNVTTYKRPKRLYVNVPFQLFADWWVDIWQVTIVIVI